MFDEIDTMVKVDCTDFGADITVLSKCIYSPGI